MSVPPFTFRPLVSGLAGPVREAQAARFRSLTRDRQKGSAQDSADDFRPLGAELPDDDDLHDAAFEAELGGDGQLLTDDDDIARDALHEDAAPGAVDAYGAGDVAGELAHDDRLPESTGDDPGDELLLDVAPIADRMPEEPAALVPPEPAPPVEEPALPTEISTDAPAEEQIVPAPVAPVLPVDLAGSIERMQTDLVTRVSDEICAVIVGALRDLVGEKYLDKAVGAFAAEISAMLGQQLGGAIAVSGPRHLIDQLTAALDDEVDNRVQFIIRDGATELSANYDSQTIVTRSAEIRDAFERAFAG